MTRPAALPRSIVWRILDGLCELITSYDIAASPAAQSRARKSASQRGSHESGSLKDLSQFDCDGPPATVSLTIDRSVGQVAGRSQLFATFDPRPLFFLLSFANKTLGISPSPSPSFTSSPHDSVGLRSSKMSAYPSGRRIRHYATPIPYRSSACLLVGFPHSLCRPSATEFSGHSNGNGRELKRGRKGREASQGPSVCTALSYFCSSPSPHLSSPPSS